MKVLFAKLLLPALIVASVVGTSFLRTTLVGSSGSNAACSYGSGLPPTVTNVTPNQGSINGGTTVSITGSSFCNTTSAVDFGPLPATSYRVVSDTLIKAVSPAEPASTVDIKVTNLNGSNLPTSTDQFSYVVIPTTSACSTNQYQYRDNNGSFWATMDSSLLSLTFTPTVDSFAVLGANADLWTSSAGYNQDIGISLGGGVYPSAPGEPEAWKESGGSNGTYSPNAAYVQVVRKVLMGIQYTAQIVWKANRPDHGSIWTGAGPIGGRFSKTCLNMQIIPVSPLAVVADSNRAHYYLLNSNGRTWNPLDPLNLRISFNVPANGVIMLSGNADLWTSNAGYNQDLGIAVSGSGYPSTAGQPQAWKESGGLGGTFSPNAAYVQVALPVTAASTVVVSLVWKASRADPAAIFAGAGPISTGFSPTSLSLIFLPTSSPPSMDSVSTMQYTLPSSDGGTWQGVDVSRFNLLFQPNNDCQLIISANVDLWTANAGFNQDIGIAVSGGGGAYPTVLGQPEIWKESGGFAGTYSPNAAFVQTTLTLSGGGSYSFQLVWKASRRAIGATIYAGAGPVVGSYSPTRLTLVPIGC